MHDGLTELHNICGAWLTGCTGCYCEAGYNKQNKQIYSPMALRRCLQVRERQPFSVGRSNKYDKCC